MRVLIYVGSSSSNPQLGIQMERAIEYIKRGDDVLLCYCDGIMSACPANLFDNKAICKACKIGFIAGLKNLPKEVRICKMGKKEPHRIYQWKNFRSVADIKSYKYKGVDIGFGVLSPIISKTRNPNPNIDTPFLEFLNYLIDQAESFVDEVENLIKIENPDLIFFFNGRGYDTKTFYNLATKHHIHFFASENVGGVRADSEYRMIKFEDTIPHDTKQTFKNCLDSWDKSTRTEEEKKKLGIGFYEKRRKGIRAGDYVYTGNQIKGKLPDSFNPEKKNIVVYCSSEDEFSSVSSEVDSYFLFSSQYNAIKYMAENINDDNYHFYVRIHPNMKGLDVEYHHNLYKLSAYENITVIAPEDPISSYALMDIAYNVVLFGSTIGAESLFWGKSVVLLGDADYYYWGVCSIPQEQKDLIKMVKEPKLFPQAKDLAIKYGYYFLDNCIAEFPKYIRITPVKNNFLGRESYSFDYLRICGSTFLFKMIRAFYLKLLAKILRNRNEMS